MKLITEDVEAIAKSRVYRAEKTTTSRFMMVAMVAMLIGAGVAYFVSQVIGACVLGVGVAIYFWRSDVIDKKAQFAARRLVTEWQNEKKEG